jgi:hypothetical protein
LSLLTSLSFSLRHSVLRHVMYTIVDRYYIYDNERETWSKSRERLTVLVYCHGGKKWNLIQKVTISSYTLCVLKTLLFDEELN